MGGRRLPGKEALAFPLILALAGLAASCRHGDAAPAPSATATLATSTPGATATDSPTPDLLGPPPRDPAEASTRLQAFLAAIPGPCAGAIMLQAAWDAACASGDLDGDGRIDTAVLVPIAAEDGRPPGTGLVLVKRASLDRLERFPPGGEADTSLSGKTIFGIAERTGDSRAELAILASTCGASTCSSRLYLESWDGSAWRDRGPATWIDGLDQVSFEGPGTRAKLIMHGGIINATGAGPQRAATTTFTFDGVGWGTRTVLPDPPAYLFHAIRDADELFDHGKFEEAARAYAAAIESKDLKDWRQEEDGTNGRDNLVGYALLRIAVATAARGEDANHALDSAIRDSKDPLFANAALAFRKGFQESGGVHGGCLEVTQYLGAAGVPELIRQAFDYGFANHPIKAFRDVCPL